MLRGNKSLYRQFGSRIVTEPVAEFVMLSELKTHLRIPATEIAQDNFLEDAIVAARSEIESTTGFAFLTQTWQLTLDGWSRQQTPWWSGSIVGSMGEIFGGPATDLIELPRYPLQTVNSITTYDEDGTDTAVTVSDVFNVDAASYPGRLAIKPGATWPVALRNINSVCINYTSGFGDEAPDVPEPFKRAVRQLAAWMYDNRSGCCSAADGYVASGAKSVMDKYRRVRL